MVRRRATAVPGSYMPLDEKEKPSDMAYPQPVSNRQEKGKRDAGVDRRKFAGRTSPKPPTPSAPSGRLVTSDGITHWLPDAGRTGQYSFKCPSCGQWFFWSVDEKQWFPNDGRTDK